MRFDPTPLLLSPAAKFSRVIPVLLDDLSKPGISLESFGCLGKYSPNLIVPAPVLEHLLLDDSYMHHLVIHSVKLEIGS